MPSGREILDIWKQSFSEQMTSPLSKLLFATMGGSLLGGGVASVANLQKNRDVKKEIPLHTVNALKEIQKHAPDAVLLSTKEDIEKNKNKVGFITRILMNILYPTDKAVAENPSFIKGKEGTRFFVLPKEVNKQVLGHEVGHYLDYEKKPFGASDLLNSLLLDETSREKAAWEASPFERKTPEEKLLEQNAIGTYQAGQTGKRVGALAGGGLYGAYKLGPKILEYLRA